MPIRSSGVDAPDLPVPAHRPAGAVEVGRIPAAATVPWDAGDRPRQRYHPPVEGAHARAGGIGGAHGDRVPAGTQRSGREPARRGERRPRSAVDPVGHRRRAVGAVVVRRREGEVLLVGTGARLRQPVHERALRGPPGAVAGDRRSGRCRRRRTDDMERERRRIGLDGLAGGDSDLQVAAGIGVAGHVAAGGEGRGGRVGGGAAARPGRLAGAPGVADLEAEQAVAGRQRRDVPGEPGGGDGGAVARLPGDVQDAGRDRGWKRRWGGG